MIILAWVFIASPAVTLTLTDYSVAQSLFAPALGVVLLLWFRLRPLRDPEHLASVEYVAPDDYHGPDALTTPFYLASCDCGWNGDDQASEAAARAEALEHTPHVRDGSTRPR
jgi:hypothetical protein